MNTQKNHKQEVTEHLSNIIKILEETGLLDFPQLMKKLGYIEDVILTINQKRVNCKKIKEALEQNQNVFIQCGRRKAWYIKNKLNKQGIKTKYEKAIIGGEKGYLFTLEK